MESVGAIPNDSSGAVGGCAQGLEALKITALESVQAMLRHANISTTQIYARAVSRLTDPAERYVKFS